MANGTGEAQEKLERVSFKGYRGNKGRPRDRQGLARQAVCTFITLGTSMDWNKNDASSLRRRITEPTSTTEHVPVKDRPLFMTCRVRPRHSAYVIIPFGVPPQSHPRWARAGRSLLGADTSEKQREKQIRTMKAATHRSTADTCPPQAFHWEPLA